jgi:phosphoglycerate kinase
VDTLRLAGRRVFLRADLNVPLDGDRIRDDSRIVAADETLRYLRSQGASVVMASHLGRPKGKRVEKYSLAPVARALDLPLAPDCIGPEVEHATTQLRPADAILLENLRFHPGEEANDPAFAEALSRLCDVYVDDAFGAAHRAHASIHALPAIVPERAAGLLMVREIEALERITLDPERPYICILGGAKVSDKLGVLRALAKRADAIVLGGAMAYTFLLASGKSVGKSLVEPDLVPVARELLESHAKIEIPIDHIVADAIDAPGTARAVADIPGNAVALDIGPRTISAIKQRLMGAATIFWNGPLGVFETPPFDRGTRAVAEVVGTSSAYSVVGGGDSLAAVRAVGAFKGISHLSTGGGASLELLEGRALPGIEILRGAR